MPAHRSDEQGAAASVVAFLLAGVIFLGSVGAILMATRDAGDADLGQPAEEAGHTLQAQALADLILDSPGYYKASPTALVVDWDGSHGATGSEELVRLGLVDPDTGMMSFEKFQNLRRAGMEADADDGLVNYPEAQEGLGLAGEDVDFHLRAFPSLKSVRELLSDGNRDPNLRVAYIGDVEAAYSSGGEFSMATAVGTPTCTVGTNMYTISVPVTNPGSTSTQLTGFFDYKAKVVANNGGTSWPTSFSDRTRSELLAPGASTTLSIDVPAKAGAGRSCTDAKLGLEIWDPNSRLGRTANNAPLALSGSGSSSGASAADLLVNPGRTYYNVGQDVVVDFAGDLPTCNPPTKPSHPPCPSVTLTLRLTSPSAATTTQAITVDKTVRSITLPAALFPAAGVYLVDLTHPGSLAASSDDVTVRDSIVVLPIGTSPARFVPGTSTVTYVHTPAVPVEVAFLDTLVEKFCGYYFDTASFAAVETPMASPPGAARCAFDRLGNPHDGDVYADTRDVLNEDLHARLIDGSPAAAAAYTKKCNGNIQGAPRYDWTRVLVVGSNVDHNSMTSADAKYAVCEWVMSGGTLIVFGSADQQVQWLQPIFHAAIVSSNNGLSTPDASHPILNVADQLAYDSYDPRGQAWSFNGQTAANQNEILTNVVQSGQSDSILTISNPGAFGDGTIILTTWLPYDLFNTGTGSANDEGLKLVNNLLMQGYRDLFLDYGPSIPTESRQASAAQRVVEIIHPEFTSVQDACGRPELVAGAIGAQALCYDPITLTVYVYVF